MSYRMDMLVSTVLMAVVFIMCVHFKMEIWVQISSSLMVYLFGTQVLGVLWELCTKISNGSSKN